MNKKTANYTTEIICPHCGYEDGDSWEVQPGCEDLGLMECANCGKAFYATRNISITYSTVEARYGTCAECSRENVPIEDHHSSCGSYNDLCVPCGYKRREQLMMEYMKQFDKPSGREGQDA